MRSARNSGNSTTASLLKSLLKGISRAMPGLGACLGDNEEIDDIKPQTRTYSDDDMGVKALSKLLEDEPPQSKLTDSDEESDNDSDNDKSLDLDTDEGTPLMIKSGRK